MPKVSEMKYGMTNEEHSAIVHRFLEGRTINQLSKEFGVYRTKIRILLEKQGLLKNLLDV